MVTLSSWCVFIPKNRWNKVASRYPGDRVENTGAHTHFAEFPPKLIRYVNVVTSNDLSEVEFFNKSKYILDSTEWLRSEATKTNDHRLEAQKDLILPRRRIEYIDKVKNMGSYHVPVLTRAD